MRFCIFGGLGFLWFSERTARMDEDRTWHSSRIFERESMRKSTDDMRALLEGFRPSRSRKISSRDCTGNVCSGRVGASYTVVKVFTATLAVNSLIFGYCRSEVALPLALSTTHAKHLQTHTANTGRDDDVCHSIPSCFGRLGAQSVII